MLCSFISFLSGYLGASGCMVLSAFGSAWGTWRAGIGICKMGADHPKGVIKNIVPIVMAGVLGIYGLIVAVIITQAISPPGADKLNTYSVYNGYTHVSKAKSVLIDNLYLDRVDLWSYILYSIFFCFIHSVCSRLVLRSFVLGCRWNNWYDW